MAFNPFNVFRRNQRALFAVVTVFIMFTFVLSSGLGGGADFFDWLPTWLGKNKKGAELCKLDGSKVGEGDVSKLRYRRVMANKFMELAAQVSLGQLDMTLSEQMKTASQQLQSLMRILLGNPFAGPEETAQQLEFIKSLVDDNGPRALPLNLSNDDKSTLRTIYAYLAIDLMRKVSGSGHHYFVNAPNRNTRDAIDYMIWLRKADEMGILFTEDDIKVLIQKEFYNQFKSDVKVREQLQKEMPGFNLSTCLEAIGDEFRVRAVQTALLGPQVLFPRDDSTHTAPALFTPPYELYDFYRERVSPTTYYAIPVPAANFTDRVTGSPTDAELRALYDKFKDQEYDPSREDPGFRQSRRVKVEWITANGTEPYYTKKAAEWIARAEEYRRLEIGVLAVPLPGVGLGFASVAVAPGAASDPLIQRSYFTDVEFKHQFIVRNQYSSAIVMPWDLLDSSIVRPANLAALSGGTIGGLLAFGGPAESAAMLYGGAIKYEQFDRVRAGMAVFGGAIPGLGHENMLFTGAAASILGNPPAVSIDAYRPTLLKQFAEHKAKELAQVDLVKLKDDLDKIAGDKDIKTPAEKTTKAKDAVAAFLKERGLTPGGTTDYRDEWSIEDDAGMAPLKAAMKGIGKADPHSGLNLPVQFGKKFFWNENSRTGKAAATGTYIADFYPMQPQKPPFGNYMQPTTEPLHVFWRSEEQAARGLTFDQAKSSGVLEAAWRRVKGRELAKNKADEIANKLRSRSVTSSAQMLQNVLDEEKILKDEFRGKEKALERIVVIPLNDVAPLAPRPMMDPNTGGMTRSIGLFGLMPSANMPYPTPDMEKSLLEERTKPIGTVLVMADQPKDVYYVVGLVNRRVLTVRDFNSEVFAPFAQRGGTGPGIQRAFNREALKKSYDSVMDLLKKEFEYVETDDQKKRIDAGPKDDGDQ